MLYTGVARNALRPMLLHVVIFLGVIRLALIVWPQKYNNMQHAPQTPMLTKTNFDFKAKKQSPIDLENNLRCPLRAVIASVGSLIFLTNFHHK